MKAGGILTRADLGGGCAFAPCGWVAGSGWSTTPNPAVNPADGITDRLGQARVHASAGMNPAPAVAPAGPAVSLNQPPPHQGETPTPPGRY